MRRPKMKMTMSTKKTYQELFEEFIRHMQMIGIAPDTVNSYQYTDNYFDRFINAKETQLIPIFVMLYQFLNMLLHKVIYWTLRWSCVISKNKEQEATLCTHIDNSSICIRRVSSLSWSR